MVNAFIFLYLSGHIVFTMLADFDKTIWCDTYYVWQNLVFVFAWGAIYSMVNTSAKKKVVGGLLFSVLMLLWNSCKLFVTVDVNDQWAVLVAFLIAIGVTVSIIMGQGKKLGI